ncbi:MAG TPA: M23 family metallopeptidase [Gaiellaceae bacterium]
MPRSLGFVIAVATLSAVSAIAAGAAGERAGYAWPVAPFDRPHPIRSTFGEPRTLFDGPPTSDTLYRGTGSFSFHNGVDIAAPDGAAVYAVRDGVVSSTAGRKVIVTSSDGASFQYWHIVPRVKAGDHVTASRTILGRIRTTYGHVHLVEFDGGHPVNPLAPGHLTPYRDATRPTIDRIEFRVPGTPSPDVLPEMIRGTVEVVVPVSDRPRPSAPGEWRTMATAPAVVRWCVVRARDGAVRVRARTIFDVRDRLPAPRAFWEVYARGTWQNDPTFLKHRYWRQEGLFLYRLGRLDTRRLADGIYRIVVNAEDIGGNTATRGATFLVYNHRLWPPPTDQS